jgi:hypothetical protein
MARASHTIPFAGRDGLGDWRPDVADVDSPFLASAINVVPAPDGYENFGALTEATAATFSGSCMGACAVKTSSGTTYVFAGSSTALYRRAIGDVAWTDVTRLAGGAYGVSLEGPWRFAKYGIYLIAVSGTETPQVIDIDSGTNFAALGGTPPTAYDVQTVGDFVVMIGLASNRRKIRWSAINDHTGWTVGTNLCDEQEFPDGHFVNGMAGDKSGYVL